MIPIICIWGHKWSRRKVIARCDNMAVVAVLSHCYSKDYVLMQLMRCLFFIEAVNSFQIQGQHIPGSLNSLADNLPKNKSDKFYSKMPCHAPHASKASSISTTVAPSPSGRLDISTLDATVQFYCSKGEASSTHRTYQSALRRFLAFRDTFSILIPFSASCRSSLMLLVYHYSSSMEKVK